ncbi:hypothetical protein ACQJBY_022797 [Aegilops geniculata]
MIFLSKAVCYALKCDRKGFFSSHLPLSLVFFVGFFHPPPTSHFTSRSYGQQLSEDSPPRTTEIWRKSEWKKRTKWERAPSQEPEIPALCCRCRRRRCLLLHLHSQETAPVDAVFSPSHHGCRSTHGQSSKLQAWMDGSRKVSFLPGWSELQIPSGPLEPAISASSSPPLPLGITSSPSASSAPSDRPQRGCPL